MPAEFPSGKYQWRIVAIRGKDVKSLEDVGLPSETWILKRQRMDPQQNAYQCNQGVRATDRNTNPRTKLDGFACAEDFGHVGAD